MLWEEMKKLWRPGRVLLLAALGFVYYSLFLEFYIAYFPNGPQMQGLYQTAGQWVDLYGPTLEEDEAAQAFAALDGLTQEADGYLQTSELARRCGVSDWDSYQAFLQEGVYSVSGELSEAQRALYQEAMLLQNYLQGGETQNIDGRIYALEQYQRAYTLWKDKAPLWASGREEPTGYTPREWAHARQSLLGPDEPWRNMLPGELPQATWAYGARLLIFMALACCLLLSPLLTGDRMARMRPLQYSARRGRGLAGVQLRACLLSGGLLWAACLLFFGLPFAAHGVGRFWGCRLFSFMCPDFCWLNCTYGVWCCLLAALALCLVLGLSALLFCLSGMSGHYVGLLLKAIPCFALAAVGSVALLTHAFYYENALAALTGLPCAEALFALSALGLGLALAAGWRRRLARADLLTE